MSDSGGNESKKLRLDDQPFSDEDLDEERTWVMDYLLGLLGLIFHLGCHQETVCVLSPRIDYLLFIFKWLIKSTSSH